jgi:hypothetical protein
LYHLNPGYTYFYVCLSIEWFEPLLHSCFTNTSLYRHHYHHKNYRDIPYTVQNNINIFHKMDSLPPSTMPSPQAGPQITRSSTRIPSIPENEPLDQQPPTPQSPSSSTTDYSHEMSLPAIITAETIPHLTDLLNRPGVRHNEQKRAWVQAKLMDAQLEMKRQRRVGRRQRSSLPMGEL